VSARSVVPAVLVALTGCIPHRIQETPHIAGRVVDSATRRPIAGATLQFERFQDQPVVTDADGRFEIPAIYPIELVYLPPSRRSPVCYLRVNAPRYQSARLKYSGWHKYLNETLALERR
jgi:hypothetical protein